MLSKEIAIDVIDHCKKDYQAIVNGKISNKLIRKDGNENNELAGSAYELYKSYKKKFFRI